MQVLVLEGGIKGWVASGPQYIQLMDGYREEHWNQLLAPEEAQEGEAVAGNSKVAQ